MARSAAKSLKVGQIISTPSHRYRIKRVIAVGGFGITYEVENLLDFVIVGTSVVVKAGEVLAMKECFREECMQRCVDGIVQLLPHKVKEGSYVRKAFFDEARAMVGMQRSLPEEMRGNLRSGLMPVYHAGIYCGSGSITKEEELTHTGNCVYFYVMPFIVGGTLDKQLGRMQPEAVESLLLRLLSALSIMHSHKDAQGDTLLHRDIKPNNIMLTREGSAVLIDFGGAVMNVRSPGYTSPEHLTRTSHLTGASDLFSLGVTMYEIITGHRPTAVEKRLNAAQDPYENELLNEDTALLAQYTMYGIKTGRDVAWGQRFLYSIDLALSLSPSLRWLSADEWLKSIFSPRQTTDGIGHDAGTISTRPVDIEENVLKTQSTDSVRVLTESTRSIPDANNTTVRQSDDRKFKKRTVLCVCGILVAFGFALIVNAIKGSGEQSDAIDLAKKEAQREVEKAKAEEARKKAETEKAKAEEARRIAEAEKAKVEEALRIAEAEKAKAEEARKNAEAEKARAAEEARKKAEEARKAAEDARKAAEEAAKKAEEEKAAAVEAAKKAEAEKTKAEEDARRRAEEAAKKAEEEKAAAVEAAKKAEAEKAKAEEEARRRAEEAKRKAEEEEAKRKEENERHESERTPEDSRNGFNIPENWFNPSPSQFNGDSEALKVSAYQKKKEELKAGKDELLEALEANKANDKGYELNELNNVVGRIMFGSYASQSSLDCAIRLELLLEACSGEQVRVAVRYPQNTKELNEFKKLLSETQKILSNEDAFQKMSESDLLLLCFMPVKLEKARWEEIYHKIKAGKQAEFPLIRERVINRLTNELK